MTSGDFQDDYRRVGSFSILNAAGRFKARYTRILLHANPLQILPISFLLEKTLSASMERKPTLTAYTKTAQKSSRDQRLGENIGICNYLARSIVRSTLLAQFWPKDTFEVRWQGMNWFLLNIQFTWSAECNNTCAVSVHEETQSMVGRSLC